MLSDEKTQEQLFIMDLVRTLLKDSGQAQTDVINNQGRTEERFDAGVVQGYWQVLSSLVSRMKIYDLDLAEYGLESYDPDDLWANIRESLSSRKGKDTPKS